jgi:cyanophycinase-like exopeptidase
VTQPKVAVLLAGTTRRRRAFKIDEATEYWARFGGDVQFAFTGRPDETEHGLAILEDPDIVVFTGGHPWLFHSRIQAHAPILDRVLELWRSGVPLSGSSAGAMAMCEWRSQLEPHRLFRLVQAFGLVPRSAAAPHFSRYQIRRVAEWTARTHPHVQVLGLEDCTALVGRDGQFRVLGAGHFTMVRHDGVQSHRPGAELALA